MSINIDHAMEMLHRWARFAERDWYPITDTGTGCYGSGFNGWGVQTNQKYLAAMAALAVRGENVHGLDCQWALERALAALRYSLRTHHVGDMNRTDGSRWGRTWISTLGTERMMHGVTLLEPHLTDDDRRRLRDMMCDEADWQCYNHTRGSRKGIQGNVWGDSGMNNPESNLWVGAHLWRTAQMYPDHPNAADWRETAHAYLINSVSVESDATDTAILGGKTIAERFVGPNFFPHFSLDHHGYLNVGYMAICVSNAAFLHFDSKLAGFEPPETLHHHQADLWALLRRLVFSNGRLARIGGDTRLRYTYCQEYLLPSLLYAADRHGDAHALGLVEGQLELIRQEMEYSGDGSFYGKRLEHVYEVNPFYYTRVESDRACVLGMLAAYLPLVDTPQAVSPSFENSVAGGWCEPEHGAVLHRSPKRFASFAWRACKLCQCICLPPDQPHLVDWEHNLAGYVRFADDSNPGKPSRRQGEHQIREFDGGFLTWGRIIEGAQIRLNEGWGGTDSADHHIAVAALPDGHTMLAVQLCRIGPHRRYLAEIKGMHLNIPNDLYNDCSRSIATPDGGIELRRPIDRTQVTGLGGKWICVDECLGAVGIYGADELQVVRSAEPVGSPYGSLQSEQVCFPYLKQTRSVKPGEIVLDSGWAVISGVAAGAVKAACESGSTARIPVSDESVRAASIAGQDGFVYILLFNTGSSDTQFGFEHLASAADLVTGERIDPGSTLSLPANTARLLRSGG